MLTLSGVNVSLVWRICALVQVCSFQSMIVRGAMSDSYLTFTLLPPLLLFFPLNQQTLFVKRVAHGGIFAHLWRSATAVAVSRRG